MRNNQWLLSDILGLLCVSLITRSYPHVFFVFSLTAQRKWALYFFQCYQSCTLDVKGQINCAAATIWSHRVLSHMGLFLSQNLGYWCLKWLDETCKKWKSFCLVITGSCTASTQWFWPVIRHCFVSQSGKNGEQIWKWCGLLGFLQSCCCKNLWLKADGLAGKYGLCVCHARTGNSSLTISQASAWNQWAITVLPVVMFKLKERTFLWSSYYGCKSILGILQEYFEWTQAL